MKRVAIKAKRFGAWSYRPAEDVVLELPAVIRIERHAAQLVAYLLICQQKVGEGHVEARQFDWRQRARTRNGMFTFPYGHSVLWLDQVEPGKRPRSSMAPTIVLDAEVRLRYVLGSPGGSAILGYVAKTDTGSMTLKGLYFGAVLRY